MHIFKIKNLSFLIRKTPPCVTKSLPGSSLDASLLICMSLWIAFCFGSLCWRGLNKQDKRVCISKFLDCKIWQDDKEHKRVCLQIDPNTSIRKLLLVDYCGCSEHFKRDHKKHPVGSNRIENKLLKMIWVKWTVGICVVGHLVSSNLKSKKLEWLTLQSQFL